MLSKLTITIPTHNRNEYLIKLLDSIPEDFDGKVLISDNGNYVTDQIKLKYSKYCFTSLLDKTKVLKNWNNALNSVKTEWFILPSDDDVFCKDIFYKIDKILFDNPAVDTFIFGHNVIDENDKILSSWSYPKNICLDGILGFKIFAKGVDSRFPSMIIRKSLVVKLGGFDESYELTAADSLLIQKCLLYGKTMFINDIIACYRTWPNNSTTQLNTQKIWLEKIRKWVDELGSVLTKEFSKDFSKSEIRNIKEEIYARNILSGVSAIRQKKGRFDALKYVLKNPFSLWADFSTKINILKTIIR